MKYANKDKHDMNIACHKIDHDAVISRLSFERLRRDIGPRAGFYVNQAAGGNRYYDQILTKHAQRIEYRDKRMIVEFAGDNHRWRDNHLIIDQEYPQSIIDSLAGKRLSEVVAGLIEQDRKIVSAHVAEGETVITIDDENLLIIDLPEGGDVQRAAMINGISSFIAMFDTRSRISR